MGGGCALGEAERLPRTLHGMNPAASSVCCCRADPGGGGGMAVAVMVVEEEEALARILSPASCVLGGRSSEPHLSAPFGEDGGVANNPSMKVPFKSSAAGGGAWCRCRHAQSRKQPARRPSTSSRKLT